MERANNYYLNSFIYISASFFINSAWLLRLFSKVLYKVTLILFCFCNFIYLLGVFFNATPPWTFLAPPQGGAPHTFNASGRVFGTQWHYNTHDASAVMCVLRAAIWLRPVSRRFVNNVAGPNSVCTEYKGKSGSCLQLLKCAAASLRSLSLYLA